jgi:hypothetical protein
MAATFQERAAAMFPWLRGALLTSFANLWSASGDPSVALSQLRQTNLYLTQFQGIRREDGTLRMDENEYMSTMVGYRVAFTEFGLDPSSFSQQDYVRMIEREVSAQEAYQAAAQAQRFREPGSGDNQLDRLFINEFIKTGSSVLALEHIRTTEQYRQVFAGNVRQDGTLRMDEQEYFAYKRGFERLFLSRGLNPQPFEAIGRFVEAVEAEVSISELDSRMRAIEQGVLAGTEETAQWFLNAYGEAGLTWLNQQGNRATALAMAFDQQVGNELLGNRITAAQIGGEAALQGFERGVMRAEQMARAGITQGAARQFYSQAAFGLEALDAVTRRFYSGDTSLEDFEDASLFGQADQQRRLGRGLAAERSQFAGRDVFRRGQSGALSGLLNR